MSSGVIAASGAGAGSTSTNPVLTVGFATIKSGNLFGFERPAPNASSVIADDEADREGYGDLAGGTIVIGGVNFEIFRFTTQSGNANFTNTLRIKRSDEGTDFSMVSASSVTSITTSVTTLSMSSMTFSQYTYYAEWTGGPVTNILGSTEGAEFELTIVQP
tara:strand:- start:177 stop:659 length:483 start_codon:yes stop_codon:yes gene_type:complete